MKTKKRNNEKKKTKDMKEKIIIFFINMNMWVQHCAKRVFKYSVMKKAVITKKTIKINKIKSRLQIIEHFQFETLNIFRA